MTNETSQAYDIALDLWGEVLDLQQELDEPTKQTFIATTHEGRFRLTTFLDPATARSPNQLLAAEQRYNVALTWHALASNVDCDRRCITIPGCSKVSSNRDFLVSPYITSASIIDRFCTDDKPITALSIANLKYLTEAVRWLAALHNTNNDRYFEMTDLAEASKTSILETQLRLLTAAYPNHLRGAARAFLDEFLDDDQDLVLGSADSIRFNLKGPVLTDFDQGHFGQGAYDIACLIRDPVVAILSQNANPELGNPGPLIDKVWLLYNLARTTESQCGLEELNTHLSLQAMNALHGPAAQHWSKLDDKQRSQVAGWAVAMLSTTIAPRS